MEWDKIKQYLIIVFIGINVFLFIFNYNLQKDDYRLTKDQQTLLSEVAKKNDFVIYSNYLTTYKPMAQIKVKRDTFNKDKIINEVFTEKPTINLGNNNIETYTSSTQSLVFDGNTVTYKNKKAKEPYKNDIAVDIEVIKSLGKETADKFVVGEFEYELSKKGFKSLNNGYRMTYYEKYKGSYIFSNTISVDITAQGIVDSVVMVRYKPMGMEKKKRDIYPVDEAIYNVIYYIRENIEQGKSGIYHVGEIDLGYYTPDIVYEAAANPCYRITLVPADASTGQKSKIIYVDAYTNEIYEQTKG